ncbi:ankyrin repeat domain-containing protein [bacterium]|nr:ankyrin repeat domain-containing protein [bacterium]
MEKLLIAIETNDHAEIRSLNTEYNLANNPIAGKYAVTYAIELSAIGVLFDDMLEEHYDLNVMDKYGATPLNTAVFSGSSNLVETLIKSGADPNRDIWMSPLYLSIVTIRDAKKKMDILLKHNAIFMNAEEKGEVIGILNGIKLNDYVDKINAIPVKNVKAK